MSGGQKIVAGLEDAVAFAKGNAFARVNLKQSRGPTLIFEGKLIAKSEEWDTRDGRMKLELYETKGGALIPVTRTWFESGREIVTAEVVEPTDHMIELASFNEQAMRFAVMDFWDWTDRARSMVRKLGWSLKREIV